MISLNLKKRIYTSIALFFLIILVLYYKFILAYTLIVLGVYAIIEFTNICVILEFGANINISQNGRIPKLVHK